MATVPASTSRVTGLFDHAPKQVLGRAQQEVKSAVHHELIKKVDLEKLLFMQDTRARQTLLTIILPWSASRACLSAPANANALRMKCWMKSSGWVRWSRCCRTPRSTTFWSIPMIRSTWNAAEFWRRPMSLSRTART